jgi:hypothetical protein
MANAMEEIQMRWNAKYAHLSEDERAALIGEETRRGLTRLKAAGVAPTMSADELMEMTRGDR